MVRIILASQSAARQAMLRGAGLAFEVIPAHVDEEKLMKEKKEAGKIAASLARQKALRVAQQNPGALVIGADQVLECEGRIFSKAKNENEAQEKLKRLRGKAHALISAVCVAEDKEILWQHTDQARLSMHGFDDEFLERYCKKAGAALTRSAGCYELEGAGAWLFEKVEGDYFTILGLPLLPLLNYLRTERGAAP